MPGFWMLTNVSTQGVITGFYGNGPLVPAIMYYQDLTCTRYWMWLSYRESCGFWTLRRVTGHHDSEFGPVDFTFNVLDIVIIGDQTAY